MLHCGYVACLSGTEDPGLLSLEFQDWVERKKLTPQAQNWLPEVSCFWQRLQIQILPGPVSRCRWVKQAGVREKRLERIVANRTLPACGAGSESTVASQSQRNLPAASLERGLSIDIFP